MLALAMTLLLPAWLSLVGCSGAAPGRAVRELQPGSYAHAFDAARDVLRDRGFDLARVDARAGVIETAPRGASGAATPWVRQSVNAEMGLRGLLQFERRVGRVSFRRAPEGADRRDAPPPDWRGDLRTWDGPIAMQVEVELERLHRSGRRVDPTSVRLTSTTLGRTVRGEELSGDVQIEQVGYDVEFSRVLADEIAKRVRRDG